MAKWNKVEHLIFKKYTVIETANKVPECRSKNQEESWTEYLSDMRAKRLKKLSRHNERSFEYDYESFS